ncbi:endothelial cell-specific molecule 1 isoform X1 [Athene cunicularia]|uniref:endothelial cell-specific molecule 1 isoform X1 n=1 Tax=Athene cunicularia TaxID=194338 RepID=UPI000EF6FA68|nr:endothelial cell-specific molecule 1 isoform X1 [Athene cunicularia]
MKGFLFLTLFLMPVHAGTAWSAKYAVDCPEPCDSNACKSTLRCKRTVLDDCGCCRVCAAALGETCYRTVSGMDGVKCGPGLKCQFYTEEDDFGDEFGICKESGWLNSLSLPATDLHRSCGKMKSLFFNFLFLKWVKHECPYGTYGMECRKTCNCPSGICDRVTGKCLKFPFFQLSASKPSNPRKIVSHTENDMASGDGNSVKEEFVKEKAIHSPVMKWLNPR